MNVTVSLEDLARSVLREHGYCVNNLWHVDDIYNLCEQNDWPMLSKSQAQEIFDILGREFDGEYGLSWPRLERAVRRYIRSRAPCEPPSEDAQP